MTKRYQFFFVLTLVLFVGGAGAQISGVLAEEANVGEKLPLKELRTFAEVFGRIKSDYVEGVDDKNLLESAIRGMLSGLDPHSSYLDQDEYLLPLLFAFFLVLLSLVWLHHVYFFSFMIPCFICCFSGSKSYLFGLMQLVSSYIFPSPIRNRVITIVIIFVCF